MEKAKLSVDIKFRTGSVAEEINDMAREAGADLILMSTHGPPGLDSLYVGGIANQLIQRLSAPLLLIRPTERWQSRGTQFKKLLVGLDGSEAAERALRYARTLARSFGGEILLLAVPEADSERGRIRDYLENVARALQERGYQARPLVTGSGAARTILEVSETEEADLILLTTHGRGGLERAVSIGSVADRVAQSADCPVFLVPI
jgi:nucleotide-binding universal stress UspA family protein